MYTEAGMLPLKKRLLDQVRDRLRVDAGQIYDIYYDRAPKDGDRRKGQWFLYRELE